MKSPLLGGAYYSRSGNLAAQRCINLYPELVETREGKAVGALYSTPGETLLATVGTGPHRGAWTTEDGYLYVVSGATAYRCDAHYNATTLGSIAGADQVEIVDNGTQVGFFSGSGGGFCWDGSGWSSIDLGFSGPVSATYQDGFAIVNELRTNRWWQSNYRDLKTWDGLNFGSKDSKPDFVRSVRSIHREVWLLGSNFSEVWVNAGVPGFVFQRLQGVFIEWGCCAQYSAALLDDSLVWLAANAKAGSGIVVRTAGYRVERISTHALEEAIRGYQRDFGTIADAIGFAYQQAGHFFYQLTFPAANVTWAWDQGSGLWTQRAAWVAPVFNRHDANSYAFFNGHHVVGDWASGNLYALDLDAYTDNGRPKKWVRSWRALPPNKSIAQPMSFDELRIDLETGLTVAAGTNPQMMLRWSDNGGSTWSNERFAPFGSTGEPSACVRFRRLGSTRQATGLDRTFELSSHEPVRAALIGAELEAE